jgi:NAD(P)-dependent dehydrogenase (short-subunit alcohol dehydrogenase family)
LPLLETAASKEDPARVLVISSTAGTNVPHVGEHGTIMYSTSKAAVNVSLLDMPAASDFTDDE